MADALRAEQERIAYVIVRLVHLAGVDGEIDVGVLVAQLAQHRQKAQRVTLAVVLAAHHVDADIEIAVAIGDGVEIPQPLLRVGQESQQRVLEAHLHAGGLGSRRGEALPIDGDHLVDAVWRAVGLYHALHVLLGLNVHDAFPSEGVHGAHQNVANQIGILQQVVEAAPDGLEELITSFVALIEPHAVEPGLLLVRVEVPQAV